MEKKKGIKRGVTFYSYQDEYRTGKLTLEDCIRVSSEIGIEGIEIIGDQMIPGSPFPEDDFFNKWESWIKKYDIEPVCNDAYINSNLYKNRWLTRKEGIQTLVNEMKFAKKLGIPIIRMNSLTPPDVFLPALPYAEMYDIILTQEIHAGFSMDHPYMIKYSDVMQKANSKYIGLCPDMGLFCKKYPRIIRDKFLSDGVQQCVADHIDEIFASGTDMRSLTSTGEGAEKEIPDEFYKFNLSDIDKEFVQYVCHFENNNINMLNEIMPYIRHIHAKFYEMTEEEEEYSIPYPDIIDLLSKEGYTDI